MAMKIKNVRGTSRLTCNCGTWKKHWKNMTGLKWPRKCGIKGCGNPAEVGAHVWSRLPQLSHDFDDFSSFDSRSSLISLSPIFVTPL